MSRVTMNKDLKEAMDTFRLAYARAVQNENWMAAVWCVDSNGEVLLDCTTWEFPKEKFEKAKGELEKFCASETSGQLPGGPLPYAEFLALTPGEQGTQDSPGNENGGPEKEPHTVEFSRLEKKDSPEGHVYDALPETDLGPDVCKEVEKSDEVRTSD